MRVTLYCTVVLLLAISGCATSGSAEAELGLRDGYEAVEVRRVGMLRIMAESRWGMTEQELQQMLGVYEDQSGEGLGKLGFEVVPHPDILQSLEGTPYHDRLGEALDIDRSLGELFEDASPAGNEERLETVMAIGTHAKVQAVFLARVVYHTEATCNGTAESEFTPHVILPDGTPRDATVPCAVSHFEAKLIDTRSGKTIWYNRALREVRAGSAQAQVPDADANARAAVDLVLHQGPTSLQMLVQR